MLAGIITENEHLYDSVTNKKGKRIRLIPNKGYQPMNNGVQIVLRVYAQEIKQDGSEVLIPIPTENNTIFYTSQQINDMFKQFNITIGPEDNYYDKFIEMLQSVLLTDTTAKGYFNGDTCVLYTPN